MTEKAQDTAGVPGEGEERKSEQAISKGPTAGMTEAQIREYVRREAQSMVAQEMNKSLGGLQRWRKGIEEKAQSFDALAGKFQEAGLLAEGADLSKVRQDILGEALTSFSDAAADEEGGNSEPGEATNVERTPESDPVWFTANLVASEHGLQQGDPELEELVTDQGPVKYIESVVAAAGKKAQRQAAGGSVGDTDLEHLVPTDMGTGKSSKKNPLEDIDDPDELLEMGLYGEK